MLSAVALRPRFALPAVLLAAVLAPIPALARAETTGLLQVQSGGFGHGVGLSQYGAYGYALHGKSYQYILGHYYTGTRLGQTDPDQTVRVLLSSGGPPTFSGADQAGADSVDPGVSYTVQPNADGTLTLQYRGTVRVRHVTGSGKHRKVSYTTKTATKSFKPLRAPLTVSGAGALQFSGRGAFDGSITFRPTGGNTVEAVESLGLDDYVAGVVPSEVPANWPRAALEAQAVAARTYAITADAGGSDFDVYDDTRSQAYGGVSAETDATNQAVQDTSGQVVTYGGRPVITYFSSSSGGHTESVQNVFIGDNPEPWLVGVDDPFDNADGHNPYHHEVDEMSLATAGQKLHGLYKGTLLGVRVLKTGVSPRVLKAEVVGSRGSSTTSGVALQKRFGLRTSWEVFQTVTATPGAAPAGSGGSAAAERSRAERAARLAAPDSASTGMTALVPLVDSLLVQAIPGLHGSLIPAAPGATVSVQLQASDGHWKQIATPTVGTDGRFDVALPGRGRYRVQYRHMLTAPVKVG